MSIYDYFVPLLTKINFSQVSFVNLHLKMYNFASLPSFGNTD